MDYESVYDASLVRLKEEGRYRIFADIGRIAGDFPYARNYAKGPERVVLWCSNDYLGQGQNQEVIAAGCQAAQQMGAGSGGTRNISGTHQQNCRAGKGNRCSAWQAKRITLRLWLYRQSGRFVDPLQDHARLHHFF